MCDGAISATIFGANSQCSYQWSNGATTQNISAICPGTYSLIVTDSLGCIAAVNAYVNNGPDTCNYLSVYVNVVEESVGGICDGEAYANVFGGYPSYSYSWDNGATTSSISNLCNGAVQVTVTDINGCSVTANAFINSPLLITASLTDASSDTLCDGSISALPSGGVPPYFYYWMPNGDTTSSINNLCNGIYEVYVSDSLGNYGYMSFMVTDPTSIVNSLNYMDSLVVDTLLTNVIFDCVIDFLTVDSMWVDTFYFT
jgi:hypothetical protein